jgi:YD repeat-containing protein
MANSASYTFDNLGRLIEVKFPSGASARYLYDAAGNRQTVFEIPATLTGPEQPTVAQLPKKQNGDFKNNLAVFLLSSGELVGFGDNSTSALATGITGNYVTGPKRLMFDPNTPPPPVGSQIVDWAFINGAVFVVFSSGHCYSAGANSYSELGHGDSVARPYLKRIEYFANNGISITKVWAFSSYSTTQGGGCVYFQASDLKMYACGKNTDGNLGNQATPTSNVSTPALCNGVPSSAESHVIDVAVSSSQANFSAYMLLSDGKLMVAGFNSVGQLGTNSTANVTGSFQYAKKKATPTSSPEDLTNVKMISVNGGYFNAVGCNALAVEYGEGEQGGVVWTCGKNGRGELANGSLTNSSVFTPALLSNIDVAGLGGGFNGYGYALTTDSQLYTWGYGGKENLFRSNTSNAESTPMLATFAPPGQVAEICFPKGNNLGTNAQMFARMSNGQIAYAGLDNGQIGVDTTVPGHTGKYKYIVAPYDILNGSKTISDIFVHGTGVTQRIFILTTSGDLYACGLNTDSICTACIPSETPAANTHWSKINFLP